MLKIAKTEFYKLKRYSVVWIGVATMLTVVLLTRFMATASDGAVHTLEYFSNSVIWNNFSLIFPATITLIAGYIIERELKTHNGCIDRKNGLHKSGMWCKGRVFRRTRQGANFI